MKKIFCRAALLLTFCISLCAFEVPAWNGPINDYANILNSSEKTELHNYLTSVNDQTGVQIALLTLPSLEGDSLEDFSIRAVEKWQLGQKGVDNGALLFVVLDERAVRIEVGYGLEGELTDMKSGLIIRNVIIPYFQKGDYATGIRQGLLNMVGVATGNAEIVSKSVQSNTTEGSASDIIISIIVLIIFFGIMGGGMFRRRRFFGFPYMGGGMHTTHNSSFGGGFGSSGGGFSGGGGGFGGGGASGRW